MSKISKIKKQKTPENGSGKKLERFGLVYPHSAGIDVGSMLMVVSYTDQDGTIHLREFNSFTESLLLLAVLLQQAGVERVAMEATGDYWKALYSILESHGIETIVVNPSHYKNVAAQKTDINDAQWLHQLLAHGLLRNSHIAPEMHRELRRYLHERDIYKKQKSDTLNRIQKIFTMMNLKVQHLISDIEGVTGMKLLRAICAGESDPEKLLNLIYSKSLKASPEDLLSSLKGDYQDQYINILSQTLKTYDFLKNQMLAYETYIEGTLQKMLTCNPTPIEKKKDWLERTNTALT